MDCFNNLTGWSWFSLEDYPQPSFLEQVEFPFIYQPTTTPPDDTSEYTADSPATSCEAVVDAQSPDSRKRRQSSESFESDALKRSRKTRRLVDPVQTAKVREIGACYCCQRKRKPCLEGDHPDGPCRRCSELLSKMKVAPGLMPPLCWRPNIGSTEIFRRGPTIDFAVSLRGNMVDAGPGKQALWKNFATRKSGKGDSKFVELSQGWTSKTMRIRLDQYKPMSTDKQYYSWFDNGVEQKYQTPAFGISNSDEANSSIGKFLVQNFDAYLDFHMRNAPEITKRTFRSAQNNMHLPLVERALKLWVGCRFIEDPWSMTGSEVLGMSKDPNPNCPYHDRIPVPPIVDLQIDLIVINDFLQPEMRRIIRTLKTMLESKDPWTNWFEIYLAYFILLHNVELTMAHDAWFVKRHNLKSKYSNKLLVNTIMQGATTLLTCFHYAHQGYAPFTNLELEHTQNWAEEQKTYLRDIRPMLQQVRGYHVHDPSRELFWTSQLHKADWKPVAVVY